MKIQTQGNTLLVSGLTELNATNAGGFRDAVRAGLNAQVTHLDVDLSETRFLDSSGLGALIALHKTCLLYTSGGGAERHAGGAAGGGHVGLLRAGRAAGRMAAVAAVMVNCAREVHVDREPSAGAGGGGPVERGV